MNDTQAAEPIRTGDLTRVPYRVYRDPAILKAEQERVFEGPVWNFLCLESEIADPGDWKTNFVGQMPVIVARIMRDGRTDLFATGVHLDRLRDDADALRFAERIVVCDSGFFDTLLAIPL